MCVSNKIYIFEKSYRYKNEIKSEIEEEINEIDGNKKAVCSLRLSKREGVIQTTINPFLKSNYIKDLDTQDKFLRPQNSSKDNTYLFFSESPPQLQKSAPSLLTSQAQAK